MRSRRRTYLGAGIVLLLLACVTSASAQQGFASDQQSRRQRRRQEQVPGLHMVDVEEHLKEPLPLDLEFTNHEGEKIRLERYFDDKRPVLLTFNYYTCPVLCSMVLEATAKAASSIGWTAGKDYEIVTISIDPRDTPKLAAKKRREMLKKYGKSDEGWHFLVGNEENIKKAAEAAGIEYFYNEAQQQYAHPAVITFLTPAGDFARYLYGLQYKPKDVRLALLEASNGKSISTVEKVILSCYRFDPDKSGYALLGWRIMEFGAAGSAVALIVILALLWRYEFRRRRQARQQQAQRASGQDPAATDEARA